MAYKDENITEIFSSKFKLSKTITTYDSRSIKYGYIRNTHQKSHMNQRAPRRTRFTPLMKEMSNETLFTHV